MLRCAFRLHRWGMLGYGLVLAVSALAQGSAFAQLAGTTAASRALFAREMGALAAQLTYLLPPPRRLDTLAGFVAWRAYGVFPLVVMVWAIAAAAGAVRGDEERQLVDTWLAARVSRTRLVASRIAAFAAAALGAAALSVLGALAGAAGTDPLALGPLAGQALALWLLAIALFSLCYLVAQLTVSPRGAQALGAAVVLVLYLLDVPARADRSLDGLAWASPFRWYRATDVLVPGGHLDAVGIGLTFAAILVAGALAALAFARRDVRGPLFARPVREGGVRDVAPSPALSWPVARLLYRQRWILLGWALITVVMAVFMVQRRPVPGVHRALLVRHRPAAARLPGGPPGGDVGLG